MLSFFILFMSQIVTSRALVRSSAASSFVRHVTLESRQHRRSIATRSSINMMPEGPEVRTLVDQLQGAVGSRLLDVQFLSGRYVRHGKPDGFDAFSKTMTPYSRNNDPSIDVIKEWNTKGKFIYIVLDNGAKQPTNNNTTDFQRSIWITLGMSGRFLNEERHEADPRHARWYLSLFMPNKQEPRRIYYHDTRNFGTVKFCQSLKALNEKLDSLGLDILDRNTTENDFVELVQEQKPELNICRFLMNQGKLAGVGNYILGMHQA